MIIKYKVLDLCSDPEHLKTLPHSTTKWNELLRLGSYPEGGMPDPQSLFAESQALVFRAVDTTRTTLMQSSFHILNDAEIDGKLPTEQLEVYPTFNDPLRKQPLKSFRTWCVPQPEPSQHL